MDVAVSDSTIVPRLLYTSNHQYLSSRSAAYCCFLQHFLLFTTTFDISLDPNLGSKLDTRPGLQIFFLIWMVCCLLSPSFPFFTLMSWHAPERVFRATILLFTNACRDWRVCAVFDSEYTIHEESRLLIVESIQIFALVWHRH